MINNNWLWKQSFSVVCHSSNVLNWKSYNQSIHQHRIRAKFESIQTSNYSKKEWFLFTILPCSTNWQFLCCSSLTISDDHGLCNGASSEFWLSFCLLFFLFYFSLLTIIFGLPIFSQLHTIHLITQNDEQLISTNWLFYTGTALVTDFIFSNSWISCFCVSLSSDANIKEYNR